MDVGQAPLFEEIGDPTARRDDDFYATPPWMTRVLLRRRPLEAGVGRVFEPCVGDGAILRELPAAADTLTNDLVARAPVVPEFLLDARRPECWEAFRKTGPIGVVITNPPFNSAFDILRAAWPYAEHGVALLLRLSWLEPTEDRGPWLEAHPPTRLIVMPRWDFRGNGETDSVTTAWLLWARSPGFCAPGIEIVGRAERDVLMRGAN
jgi:hypothetical protein